MAEAVDFQRINSVFDDMFGLSFLEPFFKTGPQTRIDILKRLLLYLLLWVVHPIYFVPQIAAFFYAGESLIQTLLNVVIFLQLFQTWYKNVFFLYYVDDLKSHCLSHDSFESSSYRKRDALMALTKTSEMMRKVARLLYTMGYSNLFFWVVLPILQTESMQSVFGVHIPIAKRNTRVLPSFYSYFIDDDVSPMREILIVFEVFLVGGGLLHYLTLDLFITAIIVMFSSQLKVINNAIADKDKANVEFKLVSEDGYVVYSQGQPDNAPIPIKQFLKDHQFMVKKYTEITKTLSPLLAMILLTTLLIICILTFLIQVSEEENGFTTTDWTIQYMRYTIFVTCAVANLFLSCWWCNKLKDAKESTHFAIYNSPWYEQNKAYKDSVLVVMSQVWQTPPITAMDLANIELGTFIDVMRLSYSYYTFLRGFTG